MSSTATTKREGGEMTTANRIIALITALTIIATTLMFAYGISAATLGQYLSFDISAQFAKMSLTLAMLIIAFSPRPRSMINRFILGGIATLVMGIATVEALSGTLLTGDAVLVIIGVLTATFESSEATIPQRKSALFLNSTPEADLFQHRS